MCISVYLIMVLAVTGLVAIAQAIMTGVWGTVLLGLIFGTLLYFVIIFIGTAIRLYEKKHPKK